MLRLILLVLLLPESADAFAAVCLQRFSNKRSSQITSNTLAAARSGSHCCMLTPLPGGTDPYVAIIKECSAAVKAAIQDGVTQLELEFPPVKGKLDVSLGETLDANGKFARELARPFSAAMGQGLWVVYPDKSEAALSIKANFGSSSSSSSSGTKQQQLPFRVTSIKEAVTEGPQSGGCQLQLVVNPGFDVTEWIQLEALMAAGQQSATSTGASPAQVVLNGSLDKVRGGYYPRIFYPGLHAAKDKYLKNFESVYYLKAMPGGWLFRRYPEEWQVILSERGCDPIVLQTSASRPEYNAAAKLVQLKQLERQRERQRLQDS